MGAGEAAVRLFGLLSVRFVHGAGRRPVARVMRRRGRDHPQAPARAGADHGLAARRVRRPAVLHHHRQDGDELVTAIAQKNGRTALIMAAIVAAMVGFAFASVPLYRMFCDADRLRRNAAARRESAGRGRRPDQRPLRRQRPSRPAVAVRARADDGQRRARRADARSSIARTNLSARAITGQAVFNVTPDQAGKYFKKIAVLLLHRADAEARADGRHAGALLRRSGDPARIPDTKDIRRDHAELHILPGGNRQRGPLEPRQSKRGKA